MENKEEILETQEIENIFDVLTPEHKNVHQRVKKIAKKWSMTGFYTESIIAKLAKDLASWGYLRFIETRKDFKLTKHFGKECFRDYYGYKKDLPKENFSSKIDIGSLESFSSKKENFDDPKEVFKVRKIRMPIIRGGYAYTKIIDGVEFVFTLKRVNCVFKYKNQWYSVNRSLQQYPDSKLNFNLKQSEFINFK